MREKKASDYRRIRGDKKFRLPQNQRGPGADQLMPAQVKPVKHEDNNPGRTPRPRNPDEL